MKILLISKEESPKYAGIIQLGNQPRKLYKSIKSITDHKD